MASASERSYTRRDTVMFLACLGLSLLGLVSPESWGLSIAAALRESVLAPLVWLQARAEEGRTSRERLRAITAQRDSASYLAQGIPSLLAENEHLRQLLSLSHRISTAYVPAEVLHQAQATDGRTLLLSVGARDRVSAFDPVVAPEGLIGMVLSVSERTSVVMTWAHPDFRVSAYAAGGRVMGMVAPSSSGSASEASLEFRAASYRDTLPSGTLILSSGLGGVYPKGIPVGTVTGVAREQAGWERIYSLRPAANPSAAAHLMVLTARADSTIATAFPSDSILAAVVADSMRAAHAQDSLLRVRIADSVRLWLQDSVRRASPSVAGAPATRDPRSATRTDSVPVQ